MKYPKLNHIYIIIELYKNNKKSDEKSLKDSDQEIFLPRVHTPLFHAKLLHRLINLMFTQLLALFILLNGIPLHLRRVAQIPDVCPEWLKVDWDFPVCILDYFSFSTYWMKSVNTPRCLKAYRRDQRFDRVIVHYFYAKQTLWKHRMEYMYANPTMIGGRIFSSKFWMMHRWSTFSIHLVVLSNTMLSGLW